MKEKEDELRNTILAQILTQEARARCKCRRTISIKINVVLIIQQ